MLIKTKSLRMSNKEFVLSKFLSGRKVPVGGVWSQALGYKDCFSYTRTVKVREIWIRN